MIWTTFTGRSGTLVQFDAEVAGELVHRQVAAVERLQQQDLAGGLLSFARRRAEEQQQARQGDASQAAARAGLAAETRAGPITSLPRARIYMSVGTMKLLLAAALFLLWMAGPLAAQPIGRGRRLRRRSDHGARCQAFM